MLFINVKRLILIGLVSTVALRGTVAEGKEKSPQTVELLCPVVRAKKEKELNQEQKRQVTLRKMLIKIDKGEDINATDKNGQTALMYAASQNNRLAVCWLVAKGADMTLKSAKGKTALMLTTDLHIRDLLQACANEKRKPTEKEKNDIQQHVRDGQSLREIVFSWCASAKEFATARKLGVDLNGTYEGKLLAQRNISPEAYAYLVRTGYSVDARADNGETALCPEMRRELAKLMLTLGMQINPENAEQELWAAVYANDPKGVTAALKKNPDLLGQSSQEASRYIRFADSGEVVQAFIDAGMNVKDTWDEGGNQVSLLNTAIMGGGNATVLKALLAAGCPMPEKGKGLLRLIAKYCPQEGAAAKLLVEAGAEVTDEDLVTAVEERSLPLVKLTLEKGANAKQALKYSPLTLLHLLYDVEGAAHKDIPAITDLLIKAGLSLNDTREYSCTLRGGVRTCPNATPLHVALLGMANQTRAGYDHWFYTPELAAERELKLSIICSLISKMKKVPADILLHAGGEDLTPQQWGDIGLLLLDKGADPKAQTDAQDTTLMTIGCYDARVAKKLIEAGVDAKAQNKFDKTALGDARSVEVVDVLLAAGANKNAIEAHMRDSAPVSIAPVVKRLLEAGADPGNALTLLGSRGFHSIGLRDEDISAVAKELIAAGAKIDLFQTNWYSLRLPLLKPILSSGIDINAQNEAGNTIMMHWICQDMLDTESLKLLLQAGTKTDIRNKDGKNALQLAQEKKQEIANKRHSSRASQLAQEKRMDDLIKILKAFTAKE